MQDGGRALANYFTILGVGIFRSCSCPRRSGRVFPVSFQQGKCYCLFCNFLSQYEWMALKVQSPENSLSCIFQAKASIYLFIFIKGAEPVWLITGKGAHLKMGRYVYLYCIHRDLGIT